MPDCCLWQCFIAVPSGDFGTVAAAHGALPDLSTLSGTSRSNPSSKMRYPCLWMGLTTKPMLNTQCTPALPCRWGFHGFALALAGLAERNSGQPLSDSDLQTALHLAECAAQALQVSSGSSSPRPTQGLQQLQGSNEVMLPDTSRVMTPSLQLHFNDASWLEAGEGVRLVHDGLSHAAAEALGVLSMR